MSTPRDISPDDEFQIGDAVRIVGGWDDGITGTISRGSWHHSETYRPGNPLPAWHIMVGDIEVGPYMAPNLIRSTDET